MPRLLCILALLCALGLPLAGAPAASLAERKVDLMTQALRARSDGDYATARDCLLQLLELAPGDEAAQRLLLGVNERIEAQAAPVPQVNVDMRQVEELTQAEALRLQGSADFVRETIKRADKLANDNKRAALALLDAALAGPPLPPEQEANLRAARDRLQPAKPAPQAAPAAPTGPAPAFHHQIVTGKAHLLAGDPAAAQEAFLAALAINPDDPSALRLLEEASLRLRQQRESERLNTRRQMLDAVDGTWAPRDVIRAPGNGDANDVDASPVQARLAKVRVPRVVFEALPLGQALDTLSALAEQEGHPVNLLHSNPGAEEPLVTVTLRDLTLDRVLHYLAERVGYEVQFDRDAAILRPSLTPGISLSTEFFPVSRSTIIRLTGMGDPPTDTYVDPLAPPTTPQAEAVSLAEAEAALRGFLERAGVPFDPVPGATLALADGQLIVTQTPVHLDKVRAILHRYQRTRQVEIEARFLEVQEGELEELGVDWMITNANEARRNDVVLSGQSGNRSLARAFGGDAVTGELIITGLPEGVGEGGTLRQSVRPPGVTGALDLGAGALPLAQISGLIGDFDVDAIIRALARRTGNDLMSAPKITVLSGKRAEIVVAQEMIYPRSYGDIDASVGRGSALEAGGSAAVAVTAGTPRDFVTRNVGVEMSVTPTVEEDNSVSLLLEPRVTEFEGFMEYGGPSVAISGDTTVTVPSGFYQPIFSVRRLRTEVTIWDGATVIMGGLTREQAVTVNDKVPVLGDIPLLGRLFRSEGQSTQKKNLLIFVTARLVSPGGGPVREE